MTAPTTLHITGQVVDMGDLDHGRGLSIETQHPGGSRLVTIIGLNFDEVRTLRMLFGEGARITIGPSDD